MLLSQYLLEKKNLISSYKYKLNWGIEAPTNSNVKFSQYFFLILSIHVLYSL